MKKFAKIGIALLTIISFSACTQDDDFTFIAQEDPDGIMFTNTATGAYTLSPSNAEGLAERFVWNAVDMGVQTPITYELQGSSNESFSSMTVLSQGTSTNAAVTVNQMLDLAEEAGLDNDPETELPNTGTLYFRVRAFAGSDAANSVDQFSDNMAISVELSENTDGAPVETKMHLYMVGDATAAGWEPANNNTPLFRDSENEHLFYFEGRFAGGADVEGFKLLETSGDWQPQWGLSEGSLSNSTILGGDPDAIPVPADALYSLVINTEEMTYSFEELEAADTTIYQTIGVLGDATPGAWDSDTDMTQSSFDPHIWYLKNVEIVEGEFKFRANDAWDVSWGIASDALSGKANLGGENMTTMGGTYDVWFNDLTGRYLLIPVTE